ncbi:MAG: iron-containing alcohol dehydrogenase [Pseudomonadota bacterium]
MTETLTGNWNYPTRIWSGPGRIADLEAACAVAGISKPLIVTDKGLAQSDIIGRVVAVLAEAGLPSTVYAKVQGNPVGRNVDEGTALYRSGGHDGVIAVGGGSGLDVGKAIAFMAGQTRPLWDFEDVGDWWTRADPDGIAPVIAVPTTAGTGSEVGRASVVVKEDVHEKKIIFHPKMLPIVVIADPELTIGLPANLTAATGLDAFVHCFEAYCAPGFHPMADGIALEGMRLVKDYLPRAYTNGGDVEARSRMLAAASMGATAFQKGLGAVHSISHPVGAFYNTHHGLTNAIVLPYVMMFNRPAIADKMIPLARYLGLDGNGFDAVYGWVLEFRKQLEIPNSLGEIGVPADQADMIGEHAQRDPSTGGNPRPTTAADMATIFRAAVSGI